MDDLRESTAWVANHSSHVTIDSSGFELPKLLSWPRPLPLDEVRVGLLHKTYVVHLMAEDMVMLAQSAFLQQLGVPKYSSGLSNIIEANTEIIPGSEEAVELQACSIHAVEIIRALLIIKRGIKVLSVEIDLWLWSVGVRSPSLRHRRTVTLYYRETFMTHSEETKDVTQRSRTRSCIK